MESSLNYALAKARLRVLLAETPEQALAYFEDSGPRGITRGQQSVLYGEALAFMGTGQPAKAVRILEALVEQNEPVIAYHSALGRAQLAAGQPSQALATFGKAAELFPRNVPLTIRYSQALLQAGSASEAHMVLLDLLNNVPPTAEQARMLALTASAAGDTGDAHYYMSEYHVLTGNLPLAVDQLRLALAVPDLHGVQRARFQARMEFIQAHIPKSKRRSVYETPPRDDSLQIAGPDDELARATR